NGTYSWSTPAESIGRVHGWHGNALALARAWSYILANGGDGLRRGAEAAVLNANWLRHRLRGVYDIPYDRPNMHEFVASTTTLKKRSGLRALDVAKRLLEEGFHAPTVYFPLIVDEALMIEPTETESPQTLEALAEALLRIADHRLHDLVGEGLLLRIPQREQVADVARDAIEDVAEATDDTVAAADHLPRLLADQPHAELLLAVALARLAVEVGVVDGPAQG